MEFSKMAVHTVRSLQLISHFLRGIWLETLPENQYVFIIAFNDKGQVKEIVEFVDSAYTNKVFGEPAEASEAKL